MCINREIKAAVAEGNALLDAQQEKLSEKDKALAQSAIEKYKKQRKTTILAERKPEEEYAGVISDENSY